MRYNISKKHSTKAERIFYEILKKNRIPFKHRWIVEGYEVDFLINNKLIVEINGHDQISERNNSFVQFGYVPVHFSNKDLINNRDLIETKLLWQLQNSAFQEL